MGFSVKTNLDIDSVNPSLFTVKVVAGYSDDEMHYSGKSMTELATELSVGTYKIPARPHLEEGIEYGLSYIKEAIEEYLRQKRGHKDPGIIGRAMVQSIKAYVYSGALHPNSAYTVAKKGRDEPLDDTGSLMRHLKYRIIRGVI